MFSLDVLLRFTLDSIASLITSLFPRKNGLDELPPITDPVLLLSALQISEQIKSGKVKCVNVVTAFRRRIEECEPKINSVVDERFAEAIEEAQKIDETIAKELESGENNLRQLPLLGVPFAVKDCFQVKGMKLTAGFIPRKDSVQTEDTSLIVNIRKCGAIPIVMTNVPELVIWIDSANMLHGRTNNPYDLSRGPGGSSGGLAACVAYGGAPFGLGSDIAGSIRLPSHFCGLFGHVITHRALLHDKYWPNFTPEQEEWMNFGPICRYSSDLITLVKGFLGERVSLLPKIDDQVNLKQLKFYYMENDGGNRHTPVHSDIKKGFQKLVGFIGTEVQSSIEKIHLAHLDQAFDIYLTIYNSKPAIKHSVKMANLVGEVNPWFELIKKSFNLSTHTLPIIIVSILENYLGRSNKDNLIAYGEEIKKQLFDILGDDGVFIYPAFPEPALNHYVTIFKFQNVGYSAIFSSMGCPITTCPIGFTSEGLPFGVQVIASPGNDHLTIAVARSIEEKFGGWKPPCHVEIQN